MKIGTIRLVPAAAYDRDSTGKKRDNWILFGAMEDRLSRGWGRKLRIVARRDRANLVSGNALVIYAVKRGVPLSATLYSAHYAPTDRPREEQIKSLTLNSRSSRCSQSMRDVTARSLTCAVPISIHCVRLFAPRSTTRNRITSLLL